MKTHKIEDIFEEDPDRRERIDKIKSEMRSEYVAYRLREIRKDRGITQTELAKMLGKSQAAVSVMETATDSKLSTVSAAIQAMGGKLEVVAVFDDDRVQLMN